MKNNNSEFYTYRITWSQEDKEHVGLCAEFPSLSYLDKNIDKALKGIIKLVSEVVKDMKKNNEEIPEPLSVKKYSGKFVVRISPDRHRDISLKALEQGVSLNHYVSAKLSAF
jgi:predicted HicB family RNase H-like nuclease